MSEKALTKVTNIEIDQDGMVIIDEWANKRAEFYGDHKEYDDPSKCQHRFIQMKQTLCAETVELEHICNQCGTINPNKNFRIGIFALPKLVHARVH